MRSRAENAPRVNVAMVINAHPALVLRAFFDSAALSAWLRAGRSITTPRPLGAYTIEWPVSEIDDDVLGRLGGVFRGTVMTFEPEHGFFLADAFWLPPAGDPIGPMATHVTCVPERPTDSAMLGAGEPATYVHVEQTGFDESLRWRRYYELAGMGMQRALTTLKMLLER